MKDRTVQISRKLLCARMLMLSFLFLALAAWPNQANAVALAATGFGPNYTRTYTLTVEGETVSVTLVNEEYSVKYKKDADGNKIGFVILDDDGKVVDTVYLLSKDPGLR